MSRSIGDISRCTLKAFETQDVVNQPREWFPLFIDERQASTQVIACNIKTSRQGTSRLTAVIAMGILQTPVRPQATINCPSFSWCAMV